MTEEDIKLICNGKTLSKMILPLPPLAEQKTHHQKTRRNPTVV